MKENRVKETKKTLRRRKDNIENRIQGKKS